MRKLLPLCLALFFSTEKMAAQCAPQLLNCPGSSAVACDLSLNSSQYWNDAQWWDNGNQLHDLAETETDINLAIKDTCIGANLFLRCQLFLDLDRDGVWETLVDTDNPPAAGMVNFGNITGVGQARSFDQRQVPANQKWRFALENTYSGDTLVTRLRWNTALNPDVFAAPELPIGYHKVRWEVSDNSGVLKTCDYNFVVKDCKSPTVVCLNGLTTNLNANKMVQLWATDFLNYTEDNVTPTPYIRLGIRKAGTGTGFPVDASGNPIASVTFDCLELKAQEIELWAIDIAGNADYCSAYVMITDEFSFCDQWGGVVDACTTVPCYDNWGVEGLVYELSYVDSGQMVSQFEMGNCELIGQYIPENTAVTITPNGDDLYNNYVGTHDLVILAKHINQEDTLDNPYQWVAADANLDGVITNADIVTCRAHILGIAPLPKLWRFVEKSYVFPWPGNPLGTPFPESATITTLDSAFVKVEFYAIPICDVSCGNVVGFFELEPENGHLIGTSQPNPTREGAMLPLQLVEEETVFFELLDAAGRLIYGNSVTLPPGDAMLDIPGYAMPTAGLYFWRIQAGKLVKSGKISKI